MFKRNILMGNTVMLGTPIVILGTNTDISGTFGTFGTFVTNIVKGNKLKRRDAYTQTLS